MSEQSEIRDEIRECLREGAVLDWFDTMAFHKGNTDLGTLRDVLKRAKEQTA